MVIAAGLSISALPARSSDNVPNMRGIPLKLAQARSKQIRNLGYALDVAVEDDARALRGVVVISFELSTVGDVMLDFRPPANEKSAIWNVNGHKVEVEQHDDHVRIEARWLKVGSNRIEAPIEAPIAAAGSALTRFIDREDGARYVYSLFVPADASSVFPCFDQPDLKAVWSLTLTTPADWRVVANGRQIESTLEGGRARHVFAPTRPLPTYLFAFAAGPFEALTESGHAQGTRLFARRSQKTRAEREAAELLRLSRLSNDFFARYFDHPFPFDKHDLVLLPEFPYGGMEHAGATFLREEAMLFRAPPTPADRLRRANTVLHENAHQWFGNLVTMRWFDDLWLKEGFANFAAAKAVEALLPEFDAWNALRNTKLAAYRTDATAGTTAIHQPLANLADAKSAYGAIVYTKAPGVLRQAEIYLGSAVFERAVRALVKQHAYGNAEWGDLVRAFEVASGRDLKVWAQAWVERRGMATVRVARPVRDGAPLTVTQSPTLGEGGVWPMRIDLGLIGADGTLTRRGVALEGERADVPLDAAPAHVIVPNAGDYGYGRFLLDPLSAERLLDQPTLIRDNLTRALAFDALWEAVRDADLAPERYIAFALAALPGEADAITAAGLYARLAYAFRAWLSDAQRDRLAPQVEALLEARMRTAPSPGERLLAMRTLAGCAWSATAQAALIALLDGRVPVGDAPLAPRDRFALVERLLVRGHPEAMRRLDEEAKRPSGEDTAVFAFATGAARGEAAVKTGYVQRFMNDDKLPEDWIEQALPSLNAVEHAMLTAPHLGPALDALPALKRRHKIFFVGAWLSAFIGGQVDGAALAAVRAAIGRPGLEADLRLKLLESVDALERTVKIRARFAADPR